MPTRFIPLFPDHIYHPFEGNGKLELNRPETPVVRAQDYWGTWNHRAIINVRNTCTLWERLLLQRYLLWLKTHALCRLKFYFWVLILVFLFCSKRPALMFRIGLQRKIIFYYWLIFCLIYKISKNPEKFSSQFPRAQTTTLFLSWKLKTCSKSLHSRSNIFFYIFCLWLCSEV